MTLLLWSRYANLKANLIRMRAKRFRARRHRPSVFFDDSIHNVESDARTLRSERECTCRSSETVENIELVGPREGQARILETQYDMP